jgi:hypothetical protein
LRILIITSCTGEKRLKDPRGLTPADFQKGRKHVRARERELKDLLTPARDLYTGEQHVRLMRGIEAITTARAEINIDLRILSAGYGLIEGDRKIAPYEQTFNDMGKLELEAWSETLGVPTSMRAVLSQPFDVGLLLLGETYLAAASLDAKVKVGGPVIAFCGKPAVPKLGAIANITPIQLSNQEAKRFSCGMVGLKGELARRLLERLSNGVSLKDMLESNDVLSLLDSVEKPNGRRTARANASVDQVITVPKVWWNKPHRERLRYFIPEWDDLVDRDFDFSNDAHSGGSGNWANEVYAHQMYPEPNYDGILVSKVVAEKSKSKKERINQLGVHRFLRVPREFPIMGDCGAFGYINQEVPPYTTEEILDYYSRLDFDFGVSIDHLIVTATESAKKERYQLTIENAAEFLKEHRKAKLSWTPIGAVQGWDAKSYAAAAKKCVAMGYKYIALGGLVRTSTSDILEVLQKVHEVVPESVQIHLFGLARIASMKKFADLGVRSVDSASLLRRAWMGAGQNYLTLDGRFYTAIRIPEAGKSFRAKRMVSEGRASAAMVERLEAKCMEAMKRFDADQMSVEQVLDVLEAYDHLITPDRLPHRELLKQTLEARPWRMCPCDICRRDGIQVVIFRGNNRNRRRGFHNTYAFYRLLQRALAGEPIVFSSSRSKEKEQLALFEDDDGLEEAVDAL